jgi:protein TonB
VVRPRYPPQAYRRQIEGSVTVGFTIMPDGSVANVRVLSSRPNNIFDREAVNAMERWRYTATGQQVESSRVFDFKLSE